MNTLSFRFLLSSPRTGAIYCSSFIYLLEDIFNFLEGVVPDAAQGVCDYKPPGRLHARDAPPEGAVGIAAAEILDGSLDSLLLVEEDPEEQKVGIVILQVVILNVFIPYYFPEILRYRILQLFEGSLLVKVEFKTVDRKQGLINGLRFGFRLIISASAGSHSHSDSAGQSKCSDSGNCVLHNILLLLVDTQNYIKAIKLWQPSHSSILLH